MKSSQPVLFEHVLNTGFQNHALLQDRDGLIWIANSGGLARYDGYALKFYKKGPGSLMTNSLLDLLERDGGTIWIGTNNGVSQFDKESNTFTNYIHDPHNPASLGGGAVYALFEDRQGVLWVGSESGLHRLDDHSSTFTNYYHDPADPASLSPGIVHAIFEDRRGALWVGTHGGLNRFNPLQNTPQRIEFEIDSQPDSSNLLITRIFEDREGVLWIGTADAGLNILDRETLQMKRFRHDPKDPASLPADYVCDIFEDRSGSLWIGCFEGGVCRFNRESQNFTRYQHQPGNPTSLATGAVARIQEDTSGILWIVMYAGNLEKYNPQASRFWLYNHNPQNSGSLSSNVVLPIYEDRQGVVWIGTGPAGLNRFNRQMDTFTHYLPDPADPKTLPAAFITALLEDSDGIFWVASSDNARSYLSQFDRQSGQCCRHFTHNPANPGSLVRGRAIRSIVQDRRDPNILWLGLNEGGFERFDKAQSIFEHHVHDPANPGSLSHNEVWPLYQDADGFLWVGMMDAARGGLACYDPRTDQLTHYQHEPHHPDSLSSNMVHDLFEDRSGNLWVATDNGLNRFDRAAGKCQRYTTLDGLPDNVIFGIHEDQDGWLWISTNDGLACFDPVSLACQTYRQSDGLQGDAFFYSAHTQTRSGEMWFGGLNGINRFDPREIHKNTHIPKVVLTSLQQGGAEVDFGKDSSRLTAIELDWQHNYFEFEFAALEYTRPEKNQYAYMLEGFDSDWYYSGTRRFGRYSNLPGGEYTLRLKGSNGDGVWNEQATSLHITVIPPFWQAALRKSEERFRSLVETSSDWVWEIDRHGVYTYSSPQAQAILGYESQEIIGNTLFTFMVEEDVAENTHCFAELAAAKGPMIRLDNRCRHKDGRMIILETNGVPIIEESGELLGYRGMHRDVTERKLAEEMLQRYAQRLEKLREIEQAILSMDSPANIARVALRYLRTLISCQRASVITFDKADQTATVIALESEGTVRMSSGYQIPLSEFAYLPQLQKGEFYSVVDLSLVTNHNLWEKLLWADGIRAYIDLPLIAQGKLVGVLNFAAKTPHAFTPQHLDVAQEVTASLALTIQQAQLLEEIRNYADHMEVRVAKRTEELLSANQEMEAFTYTVSHDLRAPLRHIQGFIELLRDHYGDKIDDEARHFIDKVSQASQKMGRLVDDLLLFSRLGRTAIHTSEVDIAAILEDVRQELLADLGDRTICWEIGKLPKVNGDAELLRMVWHNLLSNALKFTQPRPEARIEIGATPTAAEPRGEGWVTFFVRDNGVGFDPQYAHHLFGVFQRLHRQDEFDGTGIGLAITQRVIHRHGGRVWAEAQVDQGAIFYFSLRGR